MAAIGQTLTIGTSPTLIFEVVDADTYSTLDNPAANIFKAREPSDPLPLLIVIPTGVFLGDENVATDAGCQITVATIITYNVTASDSLYGVVGTGSASVGILAQRQ